MDLFEWLSGGLGEDGVEFVAEALHLLGLDVYVDGDGDHLARNEWLVDEHPRMRIEEALPFICTAEENRAHAGSHTSDDDFDRRANQLHCIIHGHTCSDGAARGVDVKSDLLAGRIHF